MRRSIVLPAASGKSTMIRRGLPANVKEADSICHHTETLELAALRDSAKLTGNWTPYDNRYGAILRERTDENIIILMASSDLSDRTGCKLIARIILKKELWLENVATRGEEPSKYEANYNSEAQEYHVVADSREELYQIVQSYCSDTA